MLQDARIKLEGRLEVVEGAARALSLAVAVARKNFAPLALAIDRSADDDLKRAEAAVSRLSASEPELKPKLEELSEARRRAVETVAARARELGIPRGSLRETASAVAGETILFEGRAVSGAHRLMLVLLPAFVGFECLMVRSPWPALIHGPVILVMLVMMLLSRKRLVVTQSRIIVGNMVLRAADVRWVEIERLLVRSPRPFLVTFELPGHTADARLPCVPDGFVIALRRLGLKVTQSPWWL